MPREGSVEAEIVTNEDGLLECCKCAKLLTLKQVAMFIRTGPETPFLPWCPACTLDVMKLAVSAIAVQVLSFDL